MTNNEAYVSILDLSRKLLNLSALQILSRYVLFKLSVKKDYKPILS